MKRMIAVGLQLLGDFRGAKLEITHVEFQADRAFVEAYTDIRGRRVPFFAESRYPTYWVMVDGTWRMTDDNPAPCELFPPTPTTLARCLGHKLPNHGRGDGTPRLEVSASSLGVSLGRDAKRSRLARARACGGTVSRTHNVRKSRAAAAQSYSRRYEPGTTSDLASSLSWHS
jgi:hypothetical protein